MQYMFTGIDKTKGYVRVQCLTVPGGRTVFFDAEGFLANVQDGSIENVPDIVMEQVRGAGYVSEIY